MLCGTKCIKFDFRYVSIYECCKRKWNLSPFHDHISHIVYIYFDCGYTEDFAVSANNFPSVHFVELEYIYAALDEERRRELITFRGLKKEHWQESILQNCWFNWIRPLCSLDTLGKVADFFLLLRNFNWDSSWDMIFWVPWYEEKEFTKLLCYFGISIGQADDDHEMETTKNDLSFHLHPKENGSTLN